MSSILDALIAAYAWASEKMLPLVAGPAASLYAGTAKDAWERVTANPDAGDAPTSPENVQSARRFLAAEALLLGGIVAAPAAYALLAPRKGKRAKAYGETTPLVNDASNRAVALLAAFGPAIALPAAYITVQKMEGAGLISKGLGDGAQGLMTAMATGGLLGTVAKLIP